MRIDPNLGISQGQGTQRAESAANSASSAAARQLPAPNQDSGDQAHLSPAAQQLSNLGQALNSVPDIRQGRVSTLSSAVQAGTYAVQNQQIAQSMLRDFRMTSSSSH